MMMIMNMIIELVGKGEQDRTSDEYDKPKPLVKTDVCVCVCVGV